MNDDTLVKTLNLTIEAIEREAVDLVDVDFDDRGQQKPSIPAADQPYFDATTETAQALRGLVEMIKARQEETL